MTAEGLSFDVEQEPLPFDDSNESDSLLFITPPETETRVRIKNCWYNFYEWIHEPTYSCLDPPTLHCRRMTHHLFILFLLTATIAIVLGCFLSYWSNSNTLLTCKSPYWNNYRLPKFLIPNQYHVHLSIPIRESKLTGTISIEFELRESTEYIVLHASSFIQESTPWENLFLWNELNEDNLGLTHYNVSHVEFNSMNEQVTLIFKETLLPSLNYTLNIPFFESQTSHGLRIYGFGWTKAFNVEGSSNDEVLGYTKLEPTGARYLFPCFDEPALKAIFEFKITTSRHFNVLFNTPSIGQYLNIESNEITHSFEKTPELSTYLIAFVIGHLKHRSILTKSGIQINIWLPYQTGNEEKEKEKDNHDPTDFALRIAKNAVEYYENYFDYILPLSKFDLVPVGSFLAEGMENWGLIIFDNSALLTSKYPTETQLRYISSLVSHEIAHHWVGDLVTMEWWNDLWLNEGFAEYFEYQRQGIFQYKHSQLVFTRISAFEMDGYVHSRPLVLKEENVNSLDAIESMFDTISYSKGASILFMVEEIMRTVPHIKKSFSTFKNHMQHWIRKNQFNIVNSNQWWHSVFPHTYENVMNHQFTHQNGYPVLCIDGNNVTSQFRYLYFQREEDGQKMDWKFPYVYSIYEISNAQNITYQTKRIKLVKNVNAVLGDTSSALNSLIELDNNSYRNNYKSNSTKYLTILNPRSNGFFRVLYKDKSWKLIEEIFSELPCDTRTGILSDRAALLTAGYLEEKEFQNFLALLMTESRMANSKKSCGIIWMVICEEITPSLLDVWALSHQYSKLKTFLNTILNPVRFWPDLSGEQYITASDIEPASIGYDDNKILSLLPPLVLPLSIQMNHSESIGTALELFNANIINGDTIDAIFAALVVQSANADHNDWIDRLKNRKEMEHILPDGGGWEHALKALSCYAGFPMMVIESATIGTGTYDMEDMLNVLLGVPSCLKPEPAKETWLVVQFYWSSLEVLFGDGVTLGKLIEPIIKSIRDEDVCKDIETWIDDITNSPGELKESLLRGVEKCRGRVQIRNKLMTNNY